MDETMVSAQSAQSASPSPTLTGLPVELKRAIIELLVPEQLPTATPFEEILADDGEKRPALIRAKGKQLESLKAQERPARSLSHVYREFRKLVAEYLWERCDFDSHSLRATGNLENIIPFYGPFVRRLVSGHLISYMLSMYEEVSTEVALLQGAEADPPVPLNPFEPRLQLSREEMERTLANYDFLARAGHFVDVLPHCTQLEELEYSEWTDTHVVGGEWCGEGWGDDFLFKTVADHLTTVIGPSLTLLKLQYAAGSTGARSQIVPILRACPNLTSLDLTLLMEPTCQLDRPSFYNALVSLTRLDRLMLLGHQLINTRAFFLLPFTCPLTSLGFCDVPPTEAIPFHTFLSNPAFRITHLDLRFLPFPVETDISTVEPFPLPHLTSLLYCIGYGETHLFSLFPPSPLSHFALCCAHALSEQDVHVFLDERIKTIEEIYLGRYVSDKEDVRGEGWSREVIYEFGYWAQEKGIKFSSHTCGAFKFFTETFFVYVR